MQVIFLFIQVFQSRATILLTLFVVVNTCFSQGVSNKLEVSDSSGYVAPPASKKDTLTYFHNGQGYPSKAQSPFFSYTSPSNISAKTKPQSIYYGMSICNVSTINVSTGWQNATSSTQGAVISVSDYDDDWKVTQAPIKARVTANKPANVVGPNPSWYPLLHSNNPPSGSLSNLSGDWICALPDNISTTSGMYRYEFTFCIDDDYVQGSSPYDIELRLYVRSDNASYVYLNGKLIGSSSYISFKASPLELTHNVPADFKNGENKIEIDNYNSESVTGLYVIGTVSTYDINNSPVDKIEQNCCTDLGGISGLVYDDLTTIPIANHPVDLYDGSGSSANLVKTVNTGMNGNYNFPLLQSGQGYEVRVVPPSGYTAMTPSIPTGGTYASIFKTIQSNVIHRADFDMRSSHTCEIEDLIVVNGSCLGKVIDFEYFDENNDLVNLYGTISYQWEIEGVIKNGRKVQHVFSAGTGFKIIKLKIVTSDTDCPGTVINTFINIKNCVGCNKCVPSFSPTPGEKYVLSAWVKEDESFLKTTYDNAAIQLVFEGVNQSTADFKATGPIIDGWQLLEQEFEIPINTTAIEFVFKDLGAGSGDGVYFDDIRVHPFQGNMKSFVYDARTGKLVAEQNEQNYTTFYEYDQEGKLVRVKVETERGIKTISETHKRTVK